MLQEVHRIIRQYANGDLSAVSLRDWIAGNVQAVLDSGDDEASTIVEELEALFAQLSEGLITEQAIVDCVNAVLRAAETEYRPIVRAVVTTTSSGSVRRQQPSQADRQVSVPA